MSSRHATALTEPPNGSRFRTRQRGCSPPSAISSRRRVPGDIVEALRRVGVFRMLAPHSHGGLALSVPAAVPVVEALSAADSSASWVTMIAVTSHTFCTRLPRATYDRLYADHPDVVGVGVGTPVGRADKIDGGYRITGRWPFASGCQNAQWIVGHCVLYQDGKPMMSGDGPLTGFFMLPAECWRIEETWQASGLTASGSHHIVLEDFHAPDASAFDLMQGMSCVPGPFERLLRSLEPFTRRSPSESRLAPSPTSHPWPARAAASFSRPPPCKIRRFSSTSSGGAAQRAARALLDVQAANHWRRAVEGTLDGKADFAESLQASAWIHAACTGVVSACYTLGGSSVVLNPSPLQRRLRDIHAARQHIFAQE
jgi:hypothetical protein